MNRNRRLKRSGDSAAGQRSMGDFVSRARAGAVEISDDEDDDIEEINTQSLTESTRESRSARLRTRRQRQEEEHSHHFPDDEQNDDWQLQEALRMSKLEAEKQEERRKMCGTIQDLRRLQVEIEPLDSSRSKSVSTETKRKTTGIDVDQREGAESPVLFSTPPEDQEQLADITAAQNVVSDIEIPASPSLPVTMRSPVPNDRSAKETGPQHATTSTEESVSQEYKAPELKRRKLALRRTKREEPDVSNQKETKTEEELKWTESENKDQVTSSKNSKTEHGSTGEKRKLVEYDDDATDDEEPIPVLKKRVSVKRKKPWVSLDISDSDDLQETDKKGSKRSPKDVSDSSPKRVAVSDNEEKNQKDPLTETKPPRTPTSMIRLSRQYKNTRCRPTTLKEAMKANIYFAPAGFSLPNYTLLIIKMFEKYRIKLRAAQSKVKTLIPWGSPVVPGVRQGNTLDLKVPGKTTPFTTAFFVRGTMHGATSTDDNNEMDFEVSECRRTLRSSTGQTKQATASTSTNKATGTAVPPYKVDSDSDDGDLLKSFLDEIARPSVITSKKKDTQNLSKNRVNSDKESADERETRKDEVLKEPAVKTQTLQDQKGNSDAGFKEDAEAETKECDKSDQASSATFGADVVLDPESSDIQSNTVNSSAEMRENDCKNSATDQTKHDGKASTSKSEHLSESMKSEDEVSLMDTDQEIQSDVVRRPKRKNLIRPVIEDDSTDDESELSQPMFSGRYTGNDTSYGCEMPVSPDSRADKVTNNPDSLASQSLTQENESQSIVGKSILETIAAENGEPIPSQTSFESDETSNKTMAENLEKDTHDAAGISPSEASSSVKQSEQWIEDQDKLVVDVDCSESKRERRLRSERAEKAAAAAEMRQRMQARQDLREACSSSSQNDFYSTSQPKKTTEVEEPESTVECPLCYQHFTTKTIEAHASDCQGPPESSSPPPPSYSRMLREEPGPSGRSVPARGTESTVYRTLTGERGELKNLKVVLQKSPVAKQKLREKSSQETDSAKRTLDFDKNSRSSGSLEQYGRGSRSFDQGLRKHGRNTRAALRTESESEVSGYEREKNEGNSEVYSWLDTSSPEKKRPKWTYGSSVGVLRNPPKLGGDYLPLKVSEESGEDSTASKVSKEQERHKQTSTRTKNVELNSDSSGSNDEDDDDDLMLQYGAKRVSKRRKEPKKVQTTLEIDENEIALAKLGSRSKKRPPSVSKVSEAKKSRRRRDSDSEDSDEVNILCELCNEKIPKEFYQQHVDEELEERNRGSKAPRKVEVVTVKERREKGSKDERRRFSPRKKAQKSFPTRSAASENTETDDQDLDVDWDKVSDSPIKCFQFTENIDSVVDYDNQFEHLKEEKSGKRRSNYGQNNSGSSRGNRGGYRGSGGRGGYRGSSNRGSYRGSYSKVYGRGKKYGKNRGSRGRK